MRSIRRIGSVEDFETLAPAFDLEALIKNQVKAFSTMTPESVIAFMNREFLRSLVGAHRLPDQNQVNRLKVALQWENDGLNGEE